MENTYQGTHKYIPIHTYIHTHTSTHTHKNPHIDAQTHIHRSVTGISIAHSSKKYNLETFSLFTLYFNQDLLK